MDLTGSIMALMRGLHLAATLSLLGTAGFIAWMLPAASVVPDQLRKSLVRLWWGSGILALIAGGLWFTLQSAAIAGATDLSDILAALPLVAAHTRYGTMLMARLGLLLAATVSALCLPRSRTRTSSQALASSSSTTMPRLHAYVSLVLTAIALGLQGVIGHAGASGGATGDELVLSEFLHLSAAGLWLGALLPLCLSTRTLTPPDAASVCERFSPVGLGCVLVLAGTGFAQGLALIGGVPALFGTTYGHIALLKIALFLLALVIAALNRLWLTDRLTMRMVNARRHLVLSVGFEALLGLAIVSAASFLASTVPGVHDVPVWPFSWQFSLITVNEDPAFRQEVLVSLLLISAALLLGVIAILRRRLRLLAFLIVLATLAWRGPSFALLTIEAYPTSFQTSPTGFSAASIVRGQTLFMPNCAGCHGASGQGDGPMAPHLRIRPTDLTMSHIWEHTDGEMFWWMTHGIDDPEGGLAMPGFAAALSSDDRWALIDYVRAHAAGAAILPDSTLDAPVRAPETPITCGNRTAQTMTDLLGSAVHVVVDTVLHDTQPVPPQSGVSTVSVLVPPHPPTDAKPESGNPASDAKPMATACIATDPAAWDAYAVLAALPPDQVAGTEFLVDPNGWLRAVQRPGTPGGWHTTAALLAALRNICAHPLKQQAGAQHEHHT